MIQTLSMLRASGAIFVPGALVRARYGIKTKSTFSKWLRRKDLEFPRPLKVGCRHYFRLSEIEAWEAAQARKYASNTDAEAQRKNGKTPGRPRKHFPQPTP